MMAHRRTICNSDCVWSNLGVRRPRMAIARLAGERLRGGRDSEARSVYADGSPSTNRSASAEAGAGYRTTTSVPPLTGVAVTTMSEKR